MSLEVTRAEVRVYRWLAAEHSYQFGQNQGIIGANPQKSLADIMGTELTSRWNSFRSYRNDRPTPDKANFLGANLKCSQQLLKATAAARAAVVWSGVLIGQRTERTQRELFELANRATFQVLRRQLHGIELEGETLPGVERLDQPLGEAIAPASITPIEGQYQPLPVFTALAGLAVTHTLEQNEIIGTMALPQPGITGGEIVAWSR